MIRYRLTYGRRIPWRTSNREIKRGRDITWELRAMPAPDWVMEQWPVDEAFDIPFQPLGLLAVLYLYWCHLIFSCFFSR